MASGVTSDGVPEPAVVERMSLGEFVALCQSIRSPTPRTRLQAAAALGCFGVKALLPLAIAVNDVEAEVRIAAIRAAGQIGTENGIALISAALHDTDHSVQMCAAEVLGRLDDPRVLEPLITAFEGCFVGKSARAIAVGTAPTHRMGTRARSRGWVYLRGQRGGDLRDWLIRRDESHGSSAASGSKPVLPGTRRGAGDGRGEVPAPRPPPLRCRVPSGGRECPAAFTRRP